MGSIAWNKALYINVKSIDGEHHRIFDLINKLRDAIDSGSSRTTLMKVLSDLLGSVAQHFANEERLMQETGYPGYAAHKEEHEKLAQSVKGLVSDFSTGKLQGAGDITDMPMRWLHTHILTVDRELGQHLLAKGVR